MVFWLYSADQYATSTPLAEDRPTGGGGMVDHGRAKTFALGSRGGDGDTF